jgi:hypothetical protein
MAQAAFFEAIIEDVLEKRVSIKYTLIPATDQFHPFLRS